MEERGCRCHRLPSGSRGPGAAGRAGQPVATTSAERSADSEQCASQNPISPLAKLLARPGVRGRRHGVGISARAGLDQYGRRALHDLRGAQRATAHAASNDRARRTFLFPPPATPERVTKRLPMRAVAGPGRASATRRNISRCSTGLSPARTPPLHGFVRGLRFRHPKPGFTFTARRLRWQLRAGGVGARDGGAASAAARRGCE